MFVVRLTERAEQDINRNADWWEEHRSKDQADRWYLGIFKAMQSLSNLPTRCGMAPEAGALDRPIRQLLFGLSRQLTHRVLFTIDGNNVVIYRVLHTAQNVLSNPDDL